MTINFSRVNHPDFYQVLEKNLQETELAYPMIYYAIPQTGYEKMNFNQLIKISDYLDQFFLVLKGSEKIRKNPINFYGVMEDVIDPIYEKIYSRFKELISKIQAIDPQMPIPELSSTNSFNRPEITIAKMKKLSDCINGATMLAFSTQNFNRVQALFECGFDPDFRSPDGSTILHGAVMTSINGPQVTLNLVRFLVEHNVRVNCIDHAGVTPLMTASLTSNLAVVNYLIENGAEINAQDDQGWNARDYASALDVPNRPSEAIIETLENHGSIKNTDTLHHNLFGNHFMCLGESYSHQCTHNLSDD
jgi:hypothetical protein